MRVRVTQSSRPTKKKERKSLSTTSDGPGPLCFRAAAIGRETEKRTEAKREREMRGFNHRNESGSDKELGEAAFSIFDSISLAGRLVELADFFLSLVFLPFFALLGLARKKWTRFFLAQLAKKKTLPPRLDPRRGAISGGRLRKTRYSKGSKRIDERARRQ